MRRRVPILPQLTPLSGAPAARGPSQAGRRMVSWEAPHHPSRGTKSTKGLPRAEGPVRHPVAVAGWGQVEARTLAPVHPSRLRMYSMCFKIYPRVSEDHPDRSWMLQMGSLSPLSATCTSRLLSFWNGRRS